MYRFGKAFSNLLLRKFHQREFHSNDFITTCSIYGFYSCDVFEIIENELQKTKEVANVIVSIANYLENAPFDKDPDWDHRVLHLTISKMNPALNFAQTNLLQTIAEKDLHLAYQLFHFRMQIMAGNEFLEDALAEMVRKDTRLFQQKFVEWLISDDEYLHIGLRYVCSSNQLGTSLFYIDSDFFAKLSVKDKLFASYKIVGYVYGMEVLQQLLISLAASIEVENETLYNSLYFIFSKYLVYNYRGTLDLLRKELKKDSLHTFAKLLFSTIIEEFENYFTALKRISVEKELKPYPKQLQLRKFYYNRMYSDVPKKVRENSLSSLFRNVALNSNKWAVRIPGELIHTPQPLGKISITKEFPSGETLDPVFQEEIRRTYQNIKKDEIRSH